MSESSGHEPREHMADRASVVETTVVDEAGTWSVDIIVVFDDEVVRRRVGTYLTRERATIAAGLIKRTAERDIPGPIHG